MSKYDISLIPLPLGRDIIKKVNFDTKDIINLMMEMDKMDVSHMEPFIGQFDTSYAGAKDYHDFICNNIQYIEDTAEDQEVITARAVFGRGYGDCKGMTAAFLVFAKCKKLNYSYNFDSYDFFDKTPTHVYASIEIEGKNIDVDCVFTVNPAVKNGVGDLKMQKKLVKYSNKFGQREKAFYRIVKKIDASKNKISGITKNWYQKAVTVGAVTVGGYLIYKGVRFLMK